jgi:uncharacterized protein YcfJ
MKNSVLKTALITSLFTAIGVSALAYFVMPRLFPAQQQPQLQPGMGYTVTTDPSLAQPGMAQPGVMQPVVYAAPAQQPYYAPRPVYRRTAPARVYDASSSAPDYSSEPVSTRQRISDANPNAAPYGRDANGEPIVKRDRSVAKSAMIVGATAGTGAAIGALAGGGRGAGIGALAGGVGGFIYDRMTHHPKQPNY